MYRQILFIAVAALLPSALSENVVFKIDKTLNDGINLDSDHVTEVQVMYGCTVNETGVQILQISVTRGRKIGREEVKLYFANEEKNILELTVTTKGFSGVLYDTPHSGSSTDLGEFSGEVGNDFQQIGAQSILRVHATWASWFPSKTNKVSGSLQSGASAIYNYYGIKNYPISLPDTMVVENFANLPCKQS